MAFEFTGTDRFSILRRLGEGSMSVVYEALDRERDQRVALKAIKYPDEDRLYRLKREFRSLSDLSHPNLIALYDLVVADDQCFYTMELVEGQTFVEYCRPSDAVDPARARAALRQLAEGLSELHGAGKIHRDLKPSNVLVTAEERVVVLDFGLIADLDSGREDSLDGQVVGTVMYMAPEQAAGNADLTAAADWYAVGSILYEALTGRMPFDGSIMEILAAKQIHLPASPRSVCEEVPADLDSLCVELLAPDASRRPTSAEVMSRLDPSAARSSEGPSTQSSRQPLFAGRREELPHIEQAFENLGRGNPAVVVINGPSGIGKTAVARHFLSRLRGEREVVVLEGRCYEREVVPYRAMDGLVDELSRYWGQLPSSDAVDLLPREADLLRRLFPVLGRVPAVAKAPRLPISEDPQDLRTRAFVALREVLQRLGQRRKLVLFLDDLQWIDNDSVTLLTDILRPPDPPLLMLIMCLRSGGGRAQTHSAISLRALDAVTAVTQAEDTVRTTIELGPLADADAVDLALQLLGRRDASLAARVARESRGNPFFVAELARYLQSAESEAALPIRLEDVVRARIANLGETSQRLLEIVAVAGEPVSPRVLATILGMGHEELERELRILRVGHLLRAPGGWAEDRVEAYHNRIRESVQNSLSEEKRREYHRVLALAFEQWGEASAEQAAWHWAGAGDDARAAENADRAADEAFAKVEFDRAARLYRLALELGTYRPDKLRALRTKLGEALAHAGRPAQAADAFLSATEGADPMDALELRRRAAEELLHGAYLDRGLGVMDDVLAEVGMRLARTPQRALAGLVARRAWVRLRGLRFRERPESEITPRELMEVDVCWAVASGLAVIDHIRGADFQSRQLLMALRVGEARRVCRAVAMEASFLASQGAVRRAARIAELARALAIQTQDEQSEVMALWAEGAVNYFSENRWRAAMSRFFEAERMLRAQGRAASWEAAQSRHFGTECLMYLGEVQFLEKRVPALRREAERRGDRFALVNLVMRMSFLALLHDNPDESERDVDDALELWSRDRTAFDVQHYWAVVARCENALYSGEPAAAEKEYAAHSGELKRSLLRRVPLVDAEALHLNGRIALALEAARPTAAGAETEAAARLQLARRSARRLRKKQSAYARGAARLLEAGLAAREGDAEREIDSLRSAIESFEAIEMQIYARAARRRLGQALGGTEGEEETRAADEWMSSVGIKKPARVTALIAPGWPD